MGTCIHTCMCEHMYVHSCIHMCIHSCMCGHVCMHMHICGYVCPCMCVHVCERTCVHVCVHVCVCMRTQTIWRPPCFPLSHLFSAAAASRHTLLETSGSPLTPSPSLPLVNNLTSSSQSRSHGLTRPPSPRFADTPTPPRGLPAALCLLRVSSVLLRFGPHPMLVLLRNLVGLVPLSPHFPFTPSLLKGLLPTGIVSACFHVSCPQNRSPLPSIFHGPSVSSLSCLKPHRGAGMLGLSFPPLTHD